MIPRRWLRLIAQAVGEREISHSEGQSMTSAVGEWVRVGQGRVASEGVANPVDSMSDEDLEKTIDRITSQIAGTSANDSDGDSGD